jgi:pimeloyl-ACP methyl ester carboxylesterase
MPWVQIGDTDLFYQERGSGQPLVFIHGNSSCSDAWFQQFEAFGDRYRVIAYDSVNHGRSSNSPRGEEEPDRADELQGFIETLTLERPVLAGTSMGGDTVQRWAARHPSDAAALIVSASGIAAPGTPAPDAGPLDPAVLMLEPGWLLSADLGARDPRLLDRYARIRSTAVRLEALRHPRPRERTMADRATLAERVQRITSPMLIVAGSADRSLPNCQRLHQLLPHSELRIVDGAPHEVYYEYAAAYNALVGEFLGRVLTPN